MHIFFNEEDLINKVGIHDHDNSEIEEIGIKYLDWGLDLGLEMGLGIRIRE